MTDDLDALAVVARAMMARSGLTDWTFAWDNAKRRRGACHWAQHRITFSRHHARYCPYADFESTMLHEIAHALAGERAGHGAKWRYINRSLGGDGRRCYETNDYLPNELRGRWRGTCEKGHEFWRHYRPGRGIYACNLCSSRYDPRYKITWVDTKPRVQR